MYDTERTIEAWKERAIEHNWDAAVPFGSFMPVRPQEILGMKQFQWPCGELGGNQPFDWISEPS